MRVDVVCPLYQAENFIEGIISSIKAQQGVEINKVIFPITKSENCSVTADVIQKHNFTYFYVEKQDFSHSITREIAINDYCESDIVIMITQDAVFEKHDAFSLLATSINEQVVYSFGRQLCKKRNIEFYARSKNYGKKSITVTKDDVKKMQLKAFFASDVFSAIHRPTFIKIGGYDGIHMMMNEDMYYAKKVIDLGYAKGYVAQAEVIHHHDFTKKQLYDRYYQTGLWFASHPEFDNYKTTDSGLKLAFYIFFRALITFNFPVIFKFFPNMIARYKGLKHGKKDGKEKANG